MKFPFYCYSFTIISMYLSFYMKYKTLYLFSGFVTRQKKKKSKLVTYCKGKRMMYRCPDRYTPAEKPKSKKLGSSKGKRSRPIGFYTPRHYKRRKSLCTNVRVSAVADKDDGSFTENSMYSIKDLTQESPK